MVSDDAITLDMDQINREKMGKRIIEESDHMDETIKDETIK